MGKKRKNMKNSPLWSKFWGFKRKITTFPQETPSFHRGTLRKQANRKQTNEKGVPNLWFSTPKYMKKISLYQSS